MNEKERKEYEEKEEGTLGKKVKRGELNNRRGGGKGKGKLGRWK